MDEEEGGGICTGRAVMDEVEGNGVGVIRVGAEGDRRGELFISDRVG